METKCPICNTDLSLKEDFEFKEVRCKNCHDYNVEYSYGDLRYNIGEFEIFLDKHNQRGLDLKEVEGIVEIISEKYKAKRNKLLR